MKLPRHIGTARMKKKHGKVKAGHIFGRKDC